MGTGVALLAQATGRRADGDVVTFLEALSDATKALEANACLEGEHDYPDFTCCKARRALANLRASEPLARMTFSLCQAAERSGRPPNRHAILRELDTLIGKAVGR